MSSERTKELAGGNCMIPWAQLPYEKGGAK